MTKGASEMGNEEYIIQWDDMTPEAKAKKERLEQDPSFRTDHMAYMKAWIRSQQISGTRS